MKMRGKKSCARKNNITKCQGYIKLGENVGSHQLFDCSLKLMRSQTTWIVAVQHLKRIIMNTSFMGLLLLSQTLNRSRKIDESPSSFVYSFASFNNKGSRGFFTCFWDWFCWMALCRSSVFISLLAARKLSSRTAILTWKNTQFTTICGPQISSSDKAFQYGNAYHIANNIRCWPKVDWVIGPNWWKELKPPVHTADCDVEHGDKGAAEGTKPLRCDLWIESHTNSWICQDAYQLLCFVLNAKSFHYTHILPKPQRWWRMSWPWQARILQVTHIKASSICHSTGLHGQNSTVESREDLRDSSQFPKYSQHAAGPKQKHKFQWYPCRGETNER